MEAVSVVVVLQPTLTNPKSAAPFGADLSLRIGKNVTKTERNLWRDALQYRSDMAELYHRHGSKMFIISEKDYNRWLKIMKKYPAVLKELRKVDSDMTPLVITPNAKSRRRH